MKNALQAAVDKVESEEDEDLECARETLSQMTLQLVADGKRCRPNAGSFRPLGPEPGIEAFSSCTVH